MNYTTLTLFAIASVGVLLHNLVKIDEINKDPSKGNFNLKTYLRREWASVLISLIVSGSAAYLQNEVKELHNAAKWLGIFFLALGYMAQSVLVRVMGKAQKFLYGK